jgi:hypothetical protein
LFYLEWLSCKKLIILIVGIIFKNSLKDKKCGG